MEDDQTIQKETPKNENRICITKNAQRNGCAVTAHNLYETFTCTTCEYKDISTCIGKKLTDIMNERAKK